MDTWLILIAISILFLCLIATIIVLIVYSGTFERILVGAGTPPIGKVVIAYKFARGPYQNTGPLFFEVATVAPDNKALGIYYDDPNTVDKNRLRHVVGCILAEDEQEVDKELQKKFEAEGFKILSLPKVEYAVNSSFPYKSAFSIFIAAQRVYPKLCEYIEEHSLSAHPFLEIYDGKTIQFMVPLDKQRGFYVPESLQQFPGEEPYEPFFSDENADLSEGGGNCLPSVNDTQDEPSLLLPSQVVKASVVTDQCADEDGTSSEPTPTVATGEVKKDPGSDEESTGSSFEDLKMEAEDVACSAPEPQFQ